MGPHRLSILESGSLWWSSDGISPAVPHPVFAYLITTRTGRNVLIDTGNPRVLVGQTNASPFFNSRMEMRPEDSLLSRLSELDLAPGDIDILVSTHLHFDHCGNHDQLARPNITHLIHCDQLEEGLRDPDGEYRALWDFPGIEWTTVDGDYEIEPGLVLLSTPGHCPGHLSVFLEAEPSPIILAIDAIDDRDALDDSTFPSFYWTDHDLWRASQQRLLNLQQETGATMYFGHARDPMAATSAP